MQIEARCFVVAAVLAGVSSLACRCSNRVSCLKSHVAGVQELPQASPDSVQEWVEGDGASKGKVIGLHLALHLLTDDAVLLGVDLVQHHPQQGRVVLAVALLANQLQRQGERRSCLLELHVTRTSEQG